MFVNPFVAGVFVTLFIELVITVALLIYLAWRTGRDETTKKVIERDEISGIGL